METLLVLIVMVFIIIICLIVLKKIEDQRTEILDIMKSKSHQRIVISMTTSPKRINKIYKVIENLEKQTIKPDLYFINLPRVFKRDGSVFTQIPSFLINEKIKLNFCEDLGPATKIIPTCKSTYIRDDDIIFSVDDDISYPSNILQMYLKYHFLYPNAVITGTSLFPLVSERSFGILKECELLEGFSCVLYKKKFLEDIPVHQFEKNIVPIYHYLSDDLVLSNFIVSKGIPILCFTNKNPVINQITPFEYGLQGDALHKGAGGLASTCAPGEHCNFVNYIETIKYMKAHGRYYLKMNENSLRRM